MNKFSVVGILDDTHFDALGREVRLRGAGVKDEVLCAVVDVEESVEHGKAEACRCSDESYCRHSAG